QRAVLALDLDLDARRGVHHPAGQRESLRETVDKWAEADPLDDSADVNMARGRCAHGQAQAPGCAFSARRARSQSIHASSPSPVRQEIGKNATPGFSTSTPWRKYSTSNSMYSARSILLSSRTSAPLNIAGYLYG